MAGLDYGGARKTKVHLRDGYGAACGRDFQYPPALSSEPFFSQSNPKNCCRKCWSIAQERKTNHD